MGLGRGFDLGAASGDPFSDQVNLRLVVLLENDNGHVSIGGRGRGGGILGGFA